jgi:hypothetical protein
MSKDKRKTTCSQITQEASGEEKPDESPDIKDKKNEKEKIELSIPTGSNISTCIGWFSVEMVWPRWLSESYVSD